MQNAKASSSLLHSDLMLAIMQQSACSRRGDLRNSVLVVQYIRAIKSQATMRRIKPFENKQAQFFALVFLKTSLFPV